MRSLNSRRRAQLSCRSLPNQCAISRAASHVECSYLLPVADPPLKHRAFCLQLGAVGGALAVGIIVILGFPIFLVCFVCGGWCCVCDSVQPSPSSFSQTNVSV